MSEKHSGPVRIAILGVGTIATAPYGILPNMHHIGDKVDLVAVADIAVDRAREVAEQFGIGKAFSNLDEMLAWGEFDAVLNLTPIPDHGETSIKILEAGKHLATEKPLATTMEDADRICELAEQQGLTVICAPPSMLYPDRLEARRLMREGVIGKACFARVRSSHGGPAAGNWPLDPTWFYQKGSGPLLDMGVYGIHEITGILGPAKRVVAFSGITEPVRTVKGGPFKGKEIEVTADDNTLMMLDFGESTFAVIDGTFNVNAAKGPKIEIYGREGTLLIDGERGAAVPLEVFQTEALPGLRGWTVPTMREVADGLQRTVDLGRAILVEHFADCLINGEAPILNADHARHELEIMLKVVESAESGQVLDLETTFRFPDEA